MLSPSANYGNFIILLYWSTITIVPYLHYINLNVFPMLSSLSTTAL